MVLLCFDSKKTKKKNPGNTLSSVILKVSARPGLWGFQLVVLYVFPIIRSFFFFFFKPGKLSLIMAPTETPDFGH